MNKTGGRYSPVIQRSDYHDSSSDIAHAMEQSLQAKLDKQSVQPYNPNSIYDQITSIISGTKPKYPSVADAVKDMQERSGFASYTQQANDFKTAKQANTEPSERKSHGPKLFEKVPQIKDTFDNYITDTRGHVSVPAILERVRAIHKRDVDDAEWTDDNLLQYINQKCDDIKKANPVADNKSGL
jgi:hypothetical protein